MRELKGIHSENGKMQVILNWNSLLSFYNQTVNQQCTVSPDFSKFSRICSALSYVAVNYPAPKRCSKPNTYGMCTRDFLTHEDANILLTSHMGTSEHKRLANPCLSRAAVGCQSGCECLWYWSTCKTYWIAQGESMRQFLSEKASHTFLSLMNPDKRGNDVT